jgi:hypothetical protein
MGTVSGGLTCCLPEWKRLSHVTDTLRERPIFHQLERRVETHIWAADFKRIRNADINRFTVDSLLPVPNPLGSRLQIKIQVRRREPAGP